jgi:protein-S-isoprenylcysteine O-methyltransferase Ste14
VKEKLNFLGIGPRIAVVLIPWLIVAIILSRIYPDFFAYTYGIHNFLLVPGIILMIIGLVFYFSTVRLLLKGLKETRLITKGPYSLCQNPLYASLIILIIPALSLLLNSWLVLTSCLTGYILFRTSIKSEYSELERIFGEPYRRYRSTTSEFFPFPSKKWFSNT